MAPTIIYFIKGGNKGSNGRTKTGRKSKAKNSRLHVGYCLRDWCKVFYEPTDRDVDDDEAAVPAKYLFQTKRGSRQTKRREPAEGEIAFLPHFDPKHIQNTNKKQREEMQKRYLNAAYEFLDADDEQIDDLIEEYTDQSHRHWQSWFDEAIKWKKSRGKRRERRRARRVEGIEAAGLDPKDVEGLSDTSDDSAYETDSDNDGDSPMRPPARPPPRGAQRHGRGCSSSGIGSSSTARRRSGQSPIDSSSDLSGKSSLGKRLARGRWNRLGAQLLPFGEDSDDNDGDIVMSGGIGGSPGPSPRGGLLRNRRRSSATGVNGFTNGVGRLGSKSFDTRPRETGTSPANAQDDDGWQTGFNIEDYQGEYDEQEAIRRATRASLAPGFHQDGTDEAYQKTFRVSMHRELQGVLPTPQATGNAAEQDVEDDDPDLAAALEAGRALGNRLPQPTVEGADGVD